jgi:hypothetical protein
LFERGHRYLLAVFAISLAGLCLRAPVLQTGFIVDDYAQLAMMAGTYPVARAPLGLFTFSDGEATENQALKDAGFFPWWTHPELKISLFRPLASALMWLDRLCFGADPLLYHLHSAAWWLGMSIVWGVLVRRFLPAPWALAVHAVCTLHPANGMLLGWIANRNASVAMLFGLLSLGLQIKRRETDNASQLTALLIPICWALTLLAGEYGVSVLVYCATYELCSDAGAREIWLRLRSCLAVLLGYALLRSALQFGSRHSGMYIDPTGEPLAFLKVGLTRGPALIADLVLGFRSNWWSAGNPWGEAVEQTFQLEQGWSFDLRSMRVVHLAAGIISSVIAAGIAMFSQRRNPKLRFAACALPLSLVPALGGTPESRLLLPAMFGWSLLQAQALLALHGQRAGRARVLRLACVWALVAVQTRASLAFSLEDRSFLPRVARAARSSILAPHMDSLASVEDAFLISAVDPTTTIYIPMLRRWHERPGPTRCHLLLNAASWIRLVRTSDDEFLLVREQHYYTPLDVYSETFQREPLQVGQVYSTGSFRATIEQVVDGMPTAVRFKTRRNLDDPAIALLTQNTSGLAIQRFPPVGQILTLPPADFPFQLMND